MIDLVVVGGGPIGLATALYAEHAGLSTIVLERRTGDIDKACGEGLMPGAVAALRDLGIEPTGLPFRGIRYTNGTRAVSADFRAGSGIGVRRTTLHRQLSELAEARGIKVVETNVHDVTQEPDHVRIGDDCGRYVAAADGLHSPIRRQLGLELSSRGPARFGLRRHFAIEPWTEYVEVHWAQRAEAYITPVGDNLVGVAILTSERGDFESQLTRFTGLSNRLGSPVGDVRGAGPLRQRTKHRTAGRVLLVGDAAGYVDALTGEGIAIGLASAQALVDAVRRDDPASYERGWLSATRRYRALTSTLLWARNQRAIGPRIVTAADRLPSVFAMAVNQLAR